MKFVADECCDEGFVVTLRESGHNVLYIPEFNPGMEDELVLKKAYKEGRILLTEDKDFGELVYRLKMQAKGIILFRIEEEEKHLKWKRFKSLLDNHCDRLFGYFIVIDKNKFRFRPLLHLI